MTRFANWQSKITLAIVLVAVGVGMGYYLSIPRAYLHGATPRVQHGLRLTTLKLKELGSKLDRVLEVWIDWVACSGARRNAPPTATGVSVPDAQRDTCSPQ